MCVPPPGASPEKVAEKRFTNVLGVYREWGQCTESPLRLHIAVSATFRRFVTGDLSLKRRLNETGASARAAMIAEWPFLDRFSQVFGIKMASRRSSIGKVQVSSCLAGVGTPVFPGYTSRCVPREHRCTFGLLTGICLYLRFTNRNLCVPGVCFRR